jgi:hypothetical protein
VKLRLDGVRLMAGLVVAAVTFRVTGMLTGVFDAPVPATETDPVYVPAAKPAGLTERLMLPGVVPLPVVVSHAVDVVAA